MEEGDSPKLKAASIGIFNLFSYPAIFIVILLVLYNGFLNSNNIVTPDLGSFPIFPKAYLWMNKYAWNNTNLGSGGIALFEYTVVGFLSLFFHYAWLAQKIWFFSLFIIGSTSFYFLLREMGGTNKIIIFIFACSYSFNPLVAGLVYNASINDTLTVYMFFPLLLFLFYKAITGEKIEWLVYTTYLSLALTYTAYWSPTIILYFLPILIISLIIITILERNVKTLLRSTGILFCVGTIYFILSLSFLQIGGIIEVVFGHGVSAFKVAGYGATNVSEIVTDLAGNFSGQLGFFYWYPFLATAVLEIFLFLFFCRNSKKYNLAIHYAMILLIITILAIWFIFHYSLEDAIYFLSAHIPEIGVYEPFYSTPMLLSLELMDIYLIIANGRSPRLKENPYEPIFNRHTTFVRIRSNMKFNKILLVSLFIVFFLLIANVNYPYGGSPSSIGMIIDSRAVNNKFSVPTGIANVSEWMNLHTNISQEYRVAVFPGGASTLTSGALISYLPTTEIPIIGFNTTFWNSALSSIQYNSNATEMVRLMSLYAVEYIIVLKVKPTGWDNPSTFEGATRFYPGGFYWDLGYTPAGTWQNWSKLFNETQGLSLSANLPSSLIYKDSFYSGKLVAYQWSKNYSLKRITQINANLFYKEEPILIPANSWTGFSQFPSWNLTSYSNGYELMDGPLCKNFTYSAKTTELTLTPDHYYSVSYSMMGRSINGSVPLVYFFSGHNYSGKVIGNVAGATFSGNLSNFKNFSFTFRTPDSFGSAQLDFVHLRSTSSNSNTTVIYKSPMIEDIANLSVVNFSYSFNNPVKGTIHLPLKGLYLIYDSSLYNSGWNVYNGNSTTKGQSFFNGLFVSTIFVVNDSQTKISIYYEPQINYNRDLILLELAWPVLFFLPMLIVTLRKFCSKKSP